MSFSQNRYPLLRDMLFTHVVFAKPVSIRVKTPGAGFAEAALLAGCERDLRKIA